MPRLGETCRAVMLEIALAQTDPAEREAMLRVMVADGWLTEAEFGRLAEARAA